MAEWSGSSQYLAATRANEILKNQYLDVFRTAFDESTVLLSRLKKKKSVPAGANYIFPVHVTRNWGVAPRAGTTSLSSNVGTYLPAPGAQGYDQGTLTRANYYGRFKIFGDALDAAKGDGGMIDLLGREMRGLKRDMAKAVNQDLFSQDGELAVISAISTTTVTVDTTHKLEVGQPIAFSIAGGNDLASTVASITSSTVFVTSDDISTNVAAGDLVVRSGLKSNVATAANKGLTGLPQAVSNASAASETPAMSTTYAGIDCSSIANWASTVNDGSGGLSIDLMLQTMQDIEAAGGNEPTIIVTDQASWRIYGNLMAPDRRWVKDVQKLDGGFKYLDFNGVPVVYDVDCTPGTMYFLHEPSIEFLEERPMSFMDKDGAVLTRVGSGTTAEDAYEATMIWRCQLATYNRADHGKITGIVAPT